MIQFSVPRRALDRLVAEVVTAARAASRLTDPRLAQVFDVEDAWDRAYIVMEWAAGETLGDLLSQGPLEPYRAARMISEAAATTAPVLVAELPGRSRRQGLFLKMMCDEGRVRMFDGHYREWPVAPINDTPEVAAMMRQRLGI